MVKQRRYRSVVQNLVADGVYSHDEGDHLLRDRPYFRVSRVVTLQPKPEYL